MLFLHIMRTNIEIDDKLMKQAMRASGAKTKKDAVAEALRLLADIKRQVGVRKLRGKIHLESDLEESRLTRQFD